MAHTSIFRDTTPGFPAQSGGIMPTQEGLRSGVYVLSNGDRMRNGETDHSNFIEARKLSCNTASRGQEFLMFPLPSP
jgi:hypothetical protein